MLVAVIDRQGAEDDLDVVDPGQVVGQAAARDRGGVAALPRLGVAPVDHAVLTEARPDDDVQQTALAARVDGGQARDRGADLTLGADDPHPARLLRHQPLAVRQQGQAPGMHQTRSHDGMGHRHGGLDAGRAGLALEGGLLIGIVGGAGLYGCAGGGGRVLAVGPAGGGKDEERGGSGEGDQTHGALLNNRCCNPE
ncbi:hypothetical protein D3C86_1352960 [compost metagenome]